MKLLSVEFQNFRLLRDLELKFSIDSERNLTVIRAANESGKTTMLTGIQWALYGDSSLPGKGEGFRLHPIDWDTSESKSVPITVTVEFELTKYRHREGSTRETKKRYRIVRAAFEEVDGNARRSSSTVKLYVLSDRGAEQLDSPETFINEELPPELREVFFTDGDRALSFIESDVAVSTKRERVQRAIRSLLGLGVIDDAIKHVRGASQDVNRQAKQFGAGSELNNIATRLEGIDNDISKYESELDDAKIQFATFDESLNDIDQKIAAILQKGDREKLQRSVDSAKNEINQLDEQLKIANKSHSKLFDGRSIAVDLLSPVLNRAYLELDKLRDQGKIPNTTVPVLQDRLEVGTCICGETLAEDTSDGKKRRKRVLKLIEDSQQADEIQKIITELYYAGKPIESEDERQKNLWLEESKKVIERRDTLQDLREEAGRKFRSLELELDAIPDADIRGLRETRRGYKDQRDRFLQKQSTAEVKLADLQRNRSELEFQRDRLLKEQTKGLRILSESQVIQDVTQVLQRSYERITKEELQKVSVLMNNIFLEMIGADPEQGAIIRRAEISSYFDIIVYGPSDRTLNPDRDLNGASRRALTLAFILALTKVSEVEAPNVIDTPLGMTSGYVKRSILRAAIRESSQLILFLTHDEISGCEEIIDAAAGVVITLTNPAHYPVMLVNDTGVKERKVLLCNCNHRSECNLCQRRSDQADLSLPGGSYGG